MRKRHKEEDIQCVCVRWFDYRYQKIKNLLHHSPNGGKRNVREAARFKAMGTRAGFPDLVLLVPRKGYTFLAIEMKDDRGRQTPKQKMMQREMERQGALYVICRSFDEFKLLVTNYFS